jgi:hypothetical protein
MRMALRPFIEEVKETLKENRRLMAELTKRGLTIDDIPILIADYTGRRLEYHQKGSVDHIEVRCRKACHKVAEHLGVPMATLRSWLDKRKLAENSATNNGKETNAFRPVSTLDDLIIKRRVSK